MDNLESHDVIENNRNYRVKATMLLKYKDFMPRAQSELRGW